MKKGFVTRGCAINPFCCTVKAFLLIGCNGCPGVILWGFLRPLPFPGATDTHRIPGTLDRHHHTPLCVIEKLSSPTEGAAAFL